MISFGQPGRGRIRLSRHTVSLFSFSDLSYLGMRDNVHWYDIGGNEVPVDAIEELESVEE